MLDRRGPLPLIALGVAVLLVACEDSPTAPGQPLTVTRLTSPVLSASYSGFDDRQRLIVRSRAEADVNIEFQSNAQMVEGAQKLAWILKAASDNYATDYPATVGPHMTNTDSTPFMNLIPAVSLRENERGTHIGAGWDPNWHQPSDVFTTYTDKDFKLGLAAAQTTLSAVAQLTGATLKK